MKNTVGIIGVVFLALLIGSVGFLYDRETVSKVPSSVAVAVPFTSLARGADAPIGRRANYLIVSPEQFRDLWEMIGAAEPRPDVDFSTYVVAAVFAGEKSTGGYDIAVSSVTDADVRTVTVTLTEPGDDCVFIQAITTPYQIIKLPRTVLDLTHKDISTTVSCSE